MKKIVTHADGRKEEIEGSPEEIAAYERQVSKEKQSEGKKPETNRRILTEEEVRAIAREEATKVIPQQIMPYVPDWTTPYDPHQPLTPDHLRPWITFGPRRYYLEVTCTETSAEKAQRRIEADWSKLLGTNIGC
jgi:hypothetical protein